MEPEVVQPTEPSEGTGETPVVDQPATEEETTEQTGDTATPQLPAADPTEPQVVVPVDVREMTVIENDKGKVAIIHEITFGDLIVSTLLMALIIFQFLSRIIRR